LLGVRSGRRIGNRSGIAVSGVGVIGLQLRIDLWY